MTVGEVVDLLSQFDRNRMLYIPDHGGVGKAELVAAVVRLRHVNVPVEGISIPDDVVLIPASMLGEEEPEDSHG